MFEIYAQTAQSNLENLQLVHQFYEDAWGKLIWMIATVGSVAVFILTLVALMLGWIIPNRTEKVRDKDLELNKKDIQDKQDKMHQSIESATELYKVELKQLTDEHQQSNKETLKTINHHSGFLWLGIAEAMWQNPGHSRNISIMYLCYAINGFVAAEWSPSEPGWPSLLDSLRKYQAIQGAQEFVASDQGIRAGVQVTMGNLRNLPQIEPYTTLLKELESLAYPGEEVSD